jgi:signal transduction histidine kinase
LESPLGSGAIEVIKSYGEIPYVECYSGELNQVFMNILSNAIDAIRDSNKEMAGRIEISTSPLAEREVEISISDNGLGMTEDLRNKIFDPFFTTKSVGKGTGMGLAITYQIIKERHQGHIECSSSYGIGTTFYIRIPI